MKTRTRTVLSAFMVMTCTLSLSGAAAAAGFAAARSQPNYQKLTGDERVMLDQAAHNAAGLTHESASGDDEHHGPWINSGPHACLIFGICGGLMGSFGGPVTGVAGAAVGCALGFVVMKIRCPNGCAE